MRSRPITEMSHKIGKRKWRRSHGDEYALVHLKVTGEPTPRKSTRRRPSTYDKPSVSR
jgi:hypothetical protein